MYMQKECLFWNGQNLFVRLVFLYIYIQLNQLFKEVSYGN